MKKIVVLFVSLTMAVFQMQAFDYNDSDDQTGPLSYDLCYVHDKHVATVPIGLCDFSQYYYQDFDKEHLNGSPIHVPDDPECFSVVTVVSPND